MRDLTINGEYFDVDSDGVLDAGETVFLEMATYTITYDYQSLNPSGTLTCSYTVTVGEIALICNNQINISLSSDGCATVIKPDMLIEGDACDGGFVINILEGADKGTDIMNYTNVGKKIRVEVVAPSGNRCWGIVLVEDKAPPIFPCQPDTSLFCGISLDPDVSGLYPTGGQDCSPFSYIFSDSEQIPYGCKRLGIGGAPDTIGRMTRTWRAVDEGGVMSPPCEQNIYLLKPKLTAANLVWPKDTILYCENNPDTRPAITGFPSVRLGTDTVPLSHTCFFGIDYRDIVFDTDCEGIQKIQRTWSILDWCSTGADLAVIQDLEPQIIKILDTIGPVISNFPDTLVYTTAHGTCSADVQLPAITVADDCSPTDAKFRILGPSSTIYNQAGVMRNVPFGTHEFTYIAEDGCGNQQRQSISLTIKDQTAPTAIARELSVSLISDTDLTWVYATSFDGGSHDNCAVASLLARKLGDVIFTDAVGFTCEDIGTVMVEIQVTDECGNIGVAMNEVVVTDKLGVCECNMDTSLKIGETSGIATNDGIICLGDRVMLTACAVGAETDGDGDGDGGSAGEGDERLAAAFTYLWSTGETIAKITFQPTTSEVYTVTITDDTGCEVVETVSIQVLPIPSAAITLEEQSLVTNDGVICAGTSITLSAPLGGVQYVWSSSSAENVVSPNNPTTTANPTETTTYTVVVTNANGCTATESVTVTVNNITASAGRDTTICAGESVQLSANGGTSFLWSPRIALSDPTVQNPIATPTVTTTYSVQITTGSGCSVIAMQTVTVNNALAATITANPNKFVISLGEDIELTATPTGGTGPYTYTWQTEAGTENTALITASPTNSFTYSVTITDAVGCTATASRSITVNPTLTAEITVPSNGTTLCLGDSVVLTAAGVGGTPGYTYQWSAVAGGGTTDTVLVQPTMTTTYIVTVTDAFGFTALASQNIVVDMAMANIIVQDTSSLLPDDGILCTNDKAILIASGGVNYSWNTGSTNDSLIVDSAGSYQVTVTNANGCESSSNIDIEIVPKIEFSKLASPATFVIGASTTLSINVTTVATNPNCNSNWG